MGLCTQLEFEPCRQGNQAKLADRGLLSVSVGQTLLDLQDWLPSHLILSVYELFHITTHSEEYLWDSSSIVVASHDQIFSPIRNDRIYLSNSWRMAKAFVDVATERIIQHGSADFAFESSPSFRHLRLPVILVQLHFKIQSSCSATRRHVCRRRHGESVFRAGGAR